VSNPHKHAALIKAWADGAQIEVRAGEKQNWIPTLKPDWDVYLEYRIKPKPDKHIMFRLEAHHALGFRFTESTHENYVKEAQYIYVTFDGETAQIKNVEVAT